MNSGPRHARRRQTWRTWALLRAGLTVTAAGAAVATTAGTASAEEPGRVGRAVEAVGAVVVDDAAGAATGALGGSGGQALGPVKDMRLNPLAGTGSDPVDNEVGTQVADFRPVSTGAVTGQLADGSSLRDTSLSRDASALLPG